MKQVGAQFSFVTDAMKQSSTLRQQLMVPRSFTQEKTIKRVTKVQKKQELSTEDSKMLGPATQPISLLTTNQVQTSKKKSIVQLIAFSKWLVLPLPKLSIRSSYWWLFQINSTSKFPKGSRRKYSNWRRLTWFQRTKRLKLLSGSLARMIAMYTIMRSGFTKAKIESRKEDRLVEESTLRWWIRELQVSVSWRNSDSALFSKTSTSLSRQSSMLTISPPFCVSRLQRTAERFISPTS